MAEDCNDVKALCDVKRSSNKLTSLDLHKDAMIQAYCWAIWKGRNDVVFEGKPFNPLVITNDIQSTVYF